MVGREVWGRGDGRGGRKSLQHRDEQRLFRNLEKNPVDEGNHGIRTYIEDPAFWLRFALRVMTDIDDIEGPLS
jgi:hypothetical protein